MSTKSTKVFRKEITSRRTLLEQVQRRIILKNPNAENLHQLLSLAKPELTVDQVHNDHDRLNAMKELMFQIHPSNFPHSEDAASLYEDVQVFYDSCCRVITGITDDESMDLYHVKKKRGRHSTPSPSTVIDSVVQFNVRQKWPFLDSYTRPITPEPLTSGKVLAPLIAYQCINARGAIAHGKKPSLIYSWENVQKCCGQSIKEVFEKHGGAKTISGGKIEEIKMELIHNGPVVSITFQPMPDFASKHSSDIVKSRVKKRHYVLIVGWKLTEFGEVWLVTNYAGTKIMHVGVGHYNIDQTIIVPKDSLENTTWQKGPYFDKDMSKFSMDWLQWPSVKFMIKSHELEHLGEVFDGEGFHVAISDRKRIVLRDKKKFAHSRSCRLEDICWDIETKAWNISLIFLDAGSNIAEHL